MFFVFFIYFHVFRLFYLFSRISKSFCHTAAALALIDQPGVGAEEIVRRAMKIAGDICVYTNHNVLLEMIDPIAIAAAKKEKEDKALAEKANFDNKSSKVTIIESEKEVVPEVVTVDVIVEDCIPTKY